MVLMPYIDAQVSEEQKRVEKEAETQRELVQQELDHLMGEKKRMALVDFTSRKRIVRFAITCSCLVLCPTAFLLFT